MTQTTKYATTKAGRRSEETEMMNTARVAISDFHNGQICYPTVSATCRGAHVTVVLDWVDQSQPSASPKHMYDHAEFTGSVAEAESWLRAKGIHLDAQGIY